MWDMVSIWETDSDFFSVLAPRGFELKNCLLYESRISEESVFEPVRTSLMLQWSLPVILISDVLLCLGVGMMHQIGLDCWTLFQSGLCVKRTSKLTPGFTLWFLFREELKCCRNGDRLRAHQSTWPRHSDQQELQQL